MKLCVSQQLSLSFAADSLGCVNVRFIFKQVKKFAIYDLLFILTSCVNINQFGKSKADSYRMMPPIIDGDTSIFGGLTSDTIWLSFSRSSGESDGESKCIKAVINKENTFDLYFYEYDSALVVPKFSLNMVSGFYHRNQGRWTLLKSAKSDESSRVILNLSKLVKQWSAYKSYYYSTSNESVLISFGRKKLLVVDTSLKMSILTSTTDAIIGYSAR